jgi:hypothetical protein
MRVGQLALTGALGGALLCSTALASPGKLLDVGKDDGLPTAFAKGTATKPRSLLIRITATPNEPVEVTWDTNCARNAKGKVREGEYTITGRALRKVKKGFKRPDDCLINVIAGYENAGLEGKIKIELFAR